MAQSGSMTRRGPVTDESAPRKPELSLLRILGTVSGITLLSRILGLLRDIMMAAAFGLSPIADAFYVAWTMPNLFRRICGEGALASALLPVYGAVKEKSGKMAAARLAAATSTRLASTLIVLIVLAEVILTFARPWIAPQIQEAVVLTQLLLPYLVFICLAGLLFGVLNSEGDFARPAWSAVQLNVIWIAALLLTRSWVPDPVLKARIIALTLVLGGVAQWWLQVQGCRLKGVSLSPEWSDVEGLSRVRASYLTIAFGMAIEQLNILADRGVAWLCVDGAGGVSALYYSMRLIQLPVALIGVALSTALFPTFVKLAVQGKTKDFGERLAQALSLTIFAILPAAVGLAVLAPEFITLLFERGEFSAAESQRTAWCLICYAPSVLFIALNMTLVRSYHAREQTTLPARTGAIAVAVNLILNFALVFSLQEAGLAIATSISSLVSTLLLLPHAGLPSPKVLIVPALRAIAMVLVMAFVVRLTASSLPLEAGKTLRVVLPVLAGIATYAGLALALKVPEARLALRIRSRQV